MVETMEEREHSYTIDGNVNWYQATMEKSMENP